MVKYIMIKIYIIGFIIGILGVIAYGAKYYYDTTQNTITTLRENNAQLTIAAETAQKSVNVLQKDIAKMAVLNKSLQEDLQRAEAYGDELRGKLSKLNLVVEALKDSKELEGKMNGATAKLWREFMQDTGGNGNRPLPQWLQQFTTGTESKSSDTNSKNSNSDSSKTQTSTTE